MSATRRSMRIQAQNASASSTPPQDISNQVEEGDVNFWASEDEDPPARQQRSGFKRERVHLPRHIDPKSIAPTRRKRGGKLRKLPEMPLDVLFEIFGHLQPYDLLRLSRASKSSRQILMQRSSAFVWRHARANVPYLPECPPGPDEPAYASLAFETRCHGCGAHGANSVYWYQYVRTCKNCSRNILTPCRKGTLEDLCKGLGIPEDRVLTPKDIEFIPPIQYCNFRMNQLVPFIRSYEAIKNENELEIWKNSKRIEKEQRGLFERNVAKWDYGWRALRKQDISAVKTQRFEDILSRMVVEGYEDVAENMDWGERTDFRQHRLVNQTKPLTDRIWNNIKPGIIELFEALQARQHERYQRRVESQRSSTFQRAFNAYCTTLPFDAILAPMRLVAAHHTAQAIIFDTRLEMKYKESDFQEAINAIPQITVTWKTELDQHLIHMLSSPEDAEGTCNTEGSSPLLATSLFRCGVCDSCHLTYRQLLGHRCGRWLEIDFRPHTFPRVEKIELCSHRNRMRALVRACGLPGNVTMDEFQRINPLVECLRNPRACRLKNPEIHRHVMYWHEMLTHDNIQSHNIVVRSLQDFVGKALIPFHFHHYRWGPYFGIYGCHHCFTPTPLTFKDLQQHLLTHHSIQLSSLESREHYIIHPSVSSGRLFYSILYTTPQ